MDLPPIVPSMLVLFSLYSFISLYILLATFLVILSPVYIHRAYISFIYSINKKCILFLYLSTWYQSHGGFGLRVCRVFSSDNTSSG